MFCTRQGRKPDIVIITLIHTIIFNTIYNGSIPVTDVWYTVQDNSTASTLSLPREGTRCYYSHSDVVWCIAVVNVTPRTISKPVFCKTEEHL